MISDVLTLVRKCLQVCLAYIKQSVSFAGHAWAQDLSASFLSVPTWSNTRVTRTTMFVSSLAPISQYYSTDARRSRLAVTFCDAEYLA